MNSLYVWAGSGFSSSLLLSSLELSDTQVHELQIRALLGTGAGGEARPLQVRGAKVHEPQIQALQKSTSLTYEP